MKIYLVGKNIYSVGVTDEAIKNVNLAMMVFDDEKVPQNYMFEQTESMAENFVGITEYGLMTFNSNKTNVDNEVLVRAVNGSEFVEKTCKIRCLMKTETGNEIATKCGGGETYTPGFGIDISDEKEISVDINEIATRDDVENLEETKQNKLESGVNIKTIDGLSVLGSGNIDTGFVAEYGATTAQKIIEYVESIPNNIAPLIIKRGNDYYTAILYVKQAANKVLLRCVGSASGNYYYFNYTITNGNWSSNSYGLQELLVSGQNIKTINNNSLLGEGNIDISGGDSNLFVAYYHAVDEEGYPIEDTPYSELYEAIISGKEIIIVDGDLFNREQNKYLVPISVEADADIIRIDCIKPFINIGSVDEGIVYLVVEFETPQWNKFIVPVGKRVNTFSFDSVEIGEFYDGTNTFPVYRKVIDVGTMPNNGTKTVEHGIFDNFVVLSIYGSMRQSTGNSLPLPLVTTNAQNQVYVACGSRNVTVQTSSDRSAFTGTVIIEYYVTD